MNRTFFNALATLVMALALTGSRASADEVATIVNDSRTNVQLYLKWSHLDEESELITLAPNERLKQRGPDGEKLFIRFNSTPAINNPPKELKYKVITANVQNGNGAGYKSTFKQRTKDVVELTGE